MDTNRKAATIIVSAILALGAATCSRSAAADTTPITDLERGFWICDYYATTRGLEATPVTECSRIMEELKERRFHGDFEALLGWWREHKPAEHRKLAAADGGLEPAALR